MPLPDGYFEALARAEDEHWWHRGMREIAAGLLVGAAPPRRALLDAGCGTGRFCRGSRSTASRRSQASTSLARRWSGRGRRSRQRTSRWPSYPSFRSRTRVRSRRVHRRPPARRGGRRRADLAELRRVLRGDGALLVGRTGASPRREGSDWRVYDRAAPSRARARRLSLSAGAYVNIVGSPAAVRGRRPAAPTETSHGIPAPRRHRRAQVRAAALQGELVRRGVTLPFGHTLVALAEPVTAPESSTR